MAPLCFFSQFSHFTEDRDSLSIRVQLDQRLQRRFHRIRIRVVAVVEKLHAVDLFDL